MTAALTSGTSAGDELRVRYATDHRLGPDPARLADLVEEAGGRAWAQAEAGRRAGLALEALHRARPEPNAAAELRALVELARQRDL